MKTIVVFLFLSFPLLAQVNQHGLLFSNTEFNYGNVENWISKIDTIQVTNSTAKKVFILKQHYPSEFEIRFPLNGIEPGQTAFVEIIFTPKKVGKFKRSIALYHTASFDSLSVKFTGEVVSFDPYAHLDCPSFTKPQQKRTEFDLEILVIDSITQKPLSNSLIELSKGESYVQYQTDANGLLRLKSNIALYHVYVEHEGYNSKELSKYFNPDRRKLILPLSAKPHKEVVTVVVPKEEKKEVVFVDTVIDKSAFTTTNFKENHFVFLIDVSGSMVGADRLPLLQKSMMELANLMRAEDKITIITYADKVLVQLQPTSGNEKQQIIEVIQGLKAKGNTAGTKALQQAYAYAQSHFIKGGVNQIILATDGGFDGLNESQDKLEKLVKKQAKKDIMLSVLAFGNNKTGKRIMEKFSVLGKGFYLFVANENEAKIKLVEVVKNMARK
ncbi:MAG: VWA domain-containing protein [Flavobacteriales bacterium]